MERKGVYKSNEFPQRMCEVYTSEKGLLADNALCLSSSKDGTIFIGTEKGLNYTKKDGSFCSFSCGAVNVISEGENGKVFFASTKTVYVFENGKNTLVLSGRVRGVAVVCGGGDNAVYREKIISLLCALLDLPMRSVSVSQ
jgi:hypothetical protein